MESDVTYAAYKAWLEQQPLSSNTKRSYLSRTKQFLSYWAGCSSAATPEQMEHAVSKYHEFLKLSAQASPTTINGSLTAIEAFLRFQAIEPPNMQREPASASPRRVLTSEECRRFVQAIRTCDSVKDRSVAMLAYSADIRLGEIAAMNVEDLSTGDDVRLLLLIRRLTRRSTGNVRERTLRLDESTSRTLLAWLIRREVLFDRVSGPIFLNRQGERMTTAGIDFTIRKVGLAANLDVCARVLRETYFARQRGVLE